MTICARICYKNNDAQEIRLPDESCREHYDCHKLRFTLSKMLRLLFDRTASRCQRLSTGLMKIRLEVFFRSFLNIQSLNSKLKQQFKLNFCTELNHSLDVVQSLNFNTQTQTHRTKPTEMAKMINTVQRRSIRSDKCVQTAFSTQFRLNLSKMSESIYKKCS